MKLAFSGEARYPVLKDSFHVYSRRVRGRLPVDYKVYCKVVKLYCASLAERLCNEGMADLPSDLGTLYASTIKRKPRYRNGKFDGFGKKDWKNGYYDGTPTAFGVVFLPNRNKSQNLRCYGFVANRALYKRLKGIYESRDCKWVPLEFNDEMI